MKPVVLILPVAALLFMGCFKKQLDCGLPNQSNHPEIFVNMVGNGEFCPEVSEGNILFLDWPYITGDDGGERTFNFVGTEGFDVIEGQINDNPNPSLKLVATRDSPIEAKVEVYAYNECGESNRGMANIKVRKTAPYVFLPRIDLPQRIALPATYTYEGKGYIVGGFRDNSSEIRHSWEYDPVDNSLTEIDPVLAGAEQAVAVVGDSAYFSYNGGRLFQVYHIPSKTKVRQFARPNPENDAFYHQVFMFPIGNKIFIGPLSLHNKIATYDITTGKFQDKIIFPAEMGGIAHHTAFYHDNRIYYFFSNDKAFVYNPSLNTLSEFNSPTIGFEAVVTAFVVKGKPYLITSSKYYSFNPADLTFSLLDVFPGNSCFTRDWGGLQWITTSLVIDDRVYFVGGKNEKTGGPKTNFFGVQF